MEFLRVIIIKKNLMCQSYYSICCFVFFLNLCNDSVKMFYFCKIGSSLKYSLFWFKISEIFCLFVHSLDIIKLTDT